MLAMQCLGLQTRCLANITGAELIFRHTCSVSTCSTFHAPHTIPIHVLLCNRFTWLLIYSFALKCSFTAHEFCSVRGGIFVGVVVWFSRGFTVINNNNNNVIIKYKLAYNRPVHVGYRLVYTTWMIGN